MRFVHARTTVRHDFFMLIQRNQMQVLDLTPQLAKAHDARAVKAFVGDGTCSLENMETSCFASESCNRGSHRLSFSLDDLIRNDLKLVCVEGDTFHGCLSAQKAEDSTALKILFPNLKIVPNSVLVSNLCVALVSRGKGVCKSLLREIFRKHSTVYVLVAREKSYNSHINTFMQNRSQNLVKLYRRLHFEMIDATPEFYVMRSVSKMAI